MKTLEAMTLKLTSLATGEVVMVPETDRLFAAFIEDAALSTGIDFRQALAELVDGGSVNTARFSYELVEVN